MQSTEVDVLIDPTTIRDMIGYIEAIQGPEMVEGMRLHFQDTQHLATLQREAKDIVQHLIYDAYEPMSSRNGEDDNGRRSMKLLESTTVSSGNDEDEGGEFYLYSNPQIAPAKIPSGPDQSYAAFFELPGKYVGFNTFIRPAGIPTRPVNYRPFFQAWVAATQKFSNTRAKAAISATIRDLQPASLKQGGFK